MCGSRRPLLLIVLALGLAAAAEPVAACPFCESTTGEQVHSGIFNADFFSNAVAILWPFPVLLGIVAAIYLGPPPWYVRVRRPEGKEATPEDAERPSRDNSSRS